ncbi:MAG: hypothetical protein Q8O67_23325 [Deltaproteobacteria bacterium]|nr:hypothetical protein [Deltaproteobacteria bacterium]
MLRVVALVLAVCSLPVLAAPPAERGVARENRMLLADARPALELRGQQEKTDQALAQRERAATAARAAAKARDAAASTVTRLKKQRAAGLEAALQQALARDEAAAQARSAVAAADVVVAREGARLLRLYDAVLAERRRAIDASPATRRAELVEPYRALVAQRDAVRRALAPLLAPTLDEEPVAGTSLDVGVDDDVEALLEKADLARDLEARLRRRSAAVHRRISELKDEASLEGDVAAAVARGQLFDEEDRRVVVTRTELSQTKAVGGSNGARGPEAGSPAPPQGPVEQNDSEGINSGPDVGFSAPVTAVPVTTSTAERPISLPTELATTTPSSMAALLALDAQLQTELEALKKKQAALKKAAADRSR